MISPINTGFGNLGSVAQATAQSANMKSEEGKISNFQKAIEEASQKEDDAQLMKAAKDFESYFLQTLMKEMRNTLSKDTLIPKNNAEMTFQSMLDEENAKNSVKGEGMGLARMIYNQMKKEASATSIKPYN